MINYVDEIIEKLNLFLEGDISIYELVEWGEKKYNIFFNREDYKILNYRLINDVLLEIRDLTEIISNENMINNGEKKYFYNEVNKMLDLLMGKENYFEVYKIKDKISDRYQLLCKTLDKYISRIISNNIIQEEELFKINRELLKHENPTKEDIILLEIMQTLMYLNEAIRVNSDEVFVGMLGNCNLGLKVKEEKVYLTQLKEILEGKREYRLSLGLNSTSIIYTNIVVL